MIRATRLAAVNTALLIRACVRCALVMHMLATQLLGLLGGTRRLGAMLETDPPSQCTAAFFFWTHLRTRGPLLAAGKLGKAAVVTGSSIELVVPASLGPAH